MEAMLSQLERIMPTALRGSVARIAGMTVAVADFPAPVGALVEIERKANSPLRAEVIGFRDQLTSCIHWPGCPACVAATACDC